MKKKMKKITIICAALVMLIVGGLFAAGCPKEDGFPVYLEPAGNYIIVLSDMGIGSTRSYVIYDDMSYVKISTGSATDAEIIEESGNLQTWDDLYDLIGFYEYEGATFSTYKIVAIKISDYPDSGIKYDTSKDNINLLIEYLKAR